MTTPRHPRDILLALLKDQEAEAAKRKAAYEAATLRVTFTRGVIEVLDQAMLPGMELAGILWPPAGLGPDATATTANPGLTFTDLVVAEAKAEAEQLPRIFNPETDAHFLGPRIVMDLPRPLHVTKEDGTGVTFVVRRRHNAHQRIGEKAQHINDVWNVEDGSVEVHSALMYSRENICEWCKAGVPFATEKRTEHYVVSKDAAGVERGFAYTPCLGVKE